MGFTHFDNDGNQRMVNVSDKDESLRKARAEGYIKVQPDTFTLIVERKGKKGDALATAQLAGIMAAKKTSELIPLCHNLNLTSVEVSFEPDEKSSSIKVLATVSTTGKTGVEMEALTAVSTACLTIYDMVKAVDKEMVISDIALVEKSGGKSGHYVRNESK